MIIKKRFKVLFGLMLLTSIVLIINSCNETDEYIVKEISLKAIEPCGFNCSHNDMELLRNISYESIGYSARTTLTQVPISLNVIRTDTGGNDLSAGQIQEQLDITNEMYLGAGIEFVICGDVNYVNDSDLSSADGGDRYELKNAYNRDNVINMYVTGSVFINQSSVCGFAYYPGGEEVVFLTNNCFRNGSTLPHELGHFFSLIHTHGSSNSPNSTDELADGSNGATTGDLIQDTPSDPRLDGSVDYNCNYTGDFLDNSGQPHNPDANNTMSYSRKECRNIFSQGQLDRMNYALVTYRSNLVCDYVEPDGSEDNPFIIDDLDRNRVYKNGDEFTNNPTVYYRKNGDLNLNSFKLRMRGQVQLTVTGDVNGTPASKISSQRGADICVLGDINTMSGAWRTGTFNENCGTPRGSIDNPIIIKRSFGKNRTLSNGDCDTNETKYYLILEDVNLNEFNFTIKGKVNLTILGDVNGSGTLIAKKCGAITVNGNINVETLEQSGGSIE